MKPIWTKVILLFYSCYVLLHSIKHRIQHCNMLYCSVCKMSIQTVKLKSAICWYVKHNTVGFIPPVQTRLWLSNFCVCEENWGKLVQLKHQASCKCITERGDKMTPNLTTHSLISPWTAPVLTLWLSILSHLLNELLHFSIIPIKLKV